MIALIRSDLRLKPEDLRKVCDPKVFGFKDTSEIETMAQIVGQDRAVKSLEFGLDVPYHGYNIFMSGHTGTGKTTMALEMANKKAAEEKVPQDLCYVYNFQKPDRPKTLHVPPGVGKKLVRDIDKLITKIHKILHKAFNGEDFELIRNQILSEFYDVTNHMYADLEDFARKQGFTISRTQAGITTIPIDNGQPLTPEEFNALSEEQRNQILDNGRMVQEKINEAIRQYKEMEKALKDRMRQLEQETARRVIAPHFAGLFDSYRQFEKVVLYLENMEQDIIESLELFSDEDEANQVSLAFFKRLDKKHALRKYKVNLIVDNSGLKHAPVIFETNPTYNNLFGSIEYEGEFGILSTDFTKIKGGSIHRANGGYLILHFMDVIRNFMVWETLKRVIKNRELTIESVTKNLGIGGTETLQPEVVAANVKVILIGEPSIYYLLYAHDDDFGKLFKIKAEFDTEMDRDEEHIHQYASIIATKCISEGLRHFTREAVARVVDYGSWLADDQRKLSAMFDQLADVVFEANTWAERDGSDLVHSEHVITAIAEKKYRAQMIEDKIMEMIENGTLMLEVSGQRVGEINGLAVYMVGDHVFGKPSRITAKTFMGEKGVVNIEREVRMSGNVHNKGVLTLGGYLGAQYAQDKPLSLSASLTFEQTYEGIDGDSASGAELFAIMSSIARLPIDQGVAVTGSVNQNGEIQPIGGVNQKIEGFYRVCKIKGLTGDQGVMIPQQNVANLMLDEEIVEKVKLGQFHIWAIETVDQGIELLMGTQAGRLEDNGDFTKDSVHYLVNKRLMEWGNRRSDVMRREYSRRFNRRG
ncbi:MAG: Lon protease family protein [Acidobacteriota bacterium]